MTDAVLVINSGSSSIKFSIFNHTNALDCLYHGKIDHLIDSPNLTLYNTQTQSTQTQSISKRGSEAGVHALFDCLKTLPHSLNIIGVGHRIVHGGHFFDKPALVTDAVIQTIESLIPMAPLHQPYNLEAIRIIRKAHSKTPQVACFDTTFHRSQETIATLFAIPRALTQQGIVRYGFHGISYEYISSVLTHHLGVLGHKRVIAMHLGNGASVCALHKGKSVATSMGFTALDGLMMGTRSGTIDPGVLLYLLTEKKMSVNELSHLLYNESGLLGVSGISSDMRQLVSSHEPSAQIAIDLFCYRAAVELTGLCTALQGCDAIVFTAGIGENSAVIRKKICERLAWLGITLDESANQNNASIISQPHSKIVVAIIPTNEETVIAKQVLGMV